MIKHSATRQVAGSNRNVQQIRQNEIYSSNTSISSSTYLSVPTSNNSVLLIPVIFVMSNMN